MKIVVVDDEMAALSAFLNEIVEEKNIECQFFKGEEKAILEYIKTHEVDAVFLDIKMPKIDGVSLARKILEIDDRMKMVFITGLSIAEEDLPEEVAEATLGFLYKPYDSEALKRFLSQIQGKRRVVTAKTFDTFDCFVDGRLVRFSSSKSKELFALLIAYNGRSLTMSDAISQLWPDGDLEKSKILYRDAVWRLRKTLNDIEVPCVIFGRALLSLNKSLVCCDYWEYLKTGKGGYRGEFCKNYDWSLDYIGELDQIAQKRSL